VYELKQSYGIVCFVEVYSGVVPSKAAVQSVIKRLVSNHAASVHHCCLDYISSHYYKSVSTEVACSSHKQ
jgi:hypothetical protein